ncbi:MAG: DUF927 domain-containing protein [Xanthobacteraceae bacterium]|nr:DUF927 domain-containing protein [Xanthobacteraceae bacterium]
MNKPFEKLTQEELASSVCVRSPELASRTVLEVVQPVPPTATNIMRWLEETKGRRPEKLYGYTDATGNSVSYTARWNNPEGKDIRPVVWTRKADGTEGWALNQLPDPRPLYNLHILAKKPKSPVIVVEGEGNCEDAAKVFPECVATTSSGGAQAAEKSDWSPLAGRSVFIWGDANDTPLANGTRPGEAYVEAVTRLAMAAGARDVKIIDGAALSSTTANGLPQPPKAGWDISDAIAEGWAPSALRDAAMATAKVAVPPPAYLSFGNFTMTDDGLYARITRGDDYEEVWISDPFEIIGRARDPHGHGWSRMMRWKDADRRIHHRAIRDEDLHVEVSTLASSLARQGLRITTGSNRRLLADYLNQSEVTNRVTVVSRTGYQDVNGKRVFVMPDETFGEVPDETVILNAVATSPYEKRGGLEDWKNGVGALIAGHSRPVLAVSVALSGPLLALIEQEGGGLNLFGESSRGKSTCAQAAASVWGKGASNPGYMRGWRATGNSLEAVAEISTDTCLVLDELGVVDAKEAGSIVYQLANGVGKSRARRDGGLREAKTWRVPLLSTGEMPMEAKIKESGRKSRAGQSVRVLDIPADGGAGFGCFDHAGPDGDPGKLADAIKHEAQTNYGTAGPEFIRRLLMLSEKDARAKILDILQRFNSQFVPDAADGQVKRAAQRLGLAAVAGELATAWGITPWTTDEAFKAAGKAFEAWMTGRGGLSSAETTDAITTVRHFIEMHGDSRFMSVNASPEDRVVHNLAGYRKGTGASRLWLIQGEVWKWEVCEGRDPNAVARTLAEHGMLERGTNGEPTKVHRIEGQPRRFYTVTAKIIGSDDDASTDQD